MIEIKQQTNIEKISDFVVSREFKSLIVVVFFAIMTLAALRSNACATDKVTWGFLGMIGLMMGFLR